MNGFIIYKVFWSNLKIKSIFPEQSAHKWTVNCQISLQRKIGHDPQVRMWNYFISKHHGKSNGSENLIFVYLLDKAGKPKRKGDQTPDKAATPVPSSAGVVDENGPGNQAISNVLSGEDIESLAVSIEELQKVSGILFN